MVAGSLIVPEDDEASVAEFVANSLLEGDRFANHRSRSLRKGSLGCCRPDR